MYIWKETYIYVKSFIRVRCGTFRREKSPIWICENKLYLYVKRGLYRCLSRVFTSIRERSAVQNTFSLVYIYIPDIYLHKHIDWRHTTSFLRYIHVYLICVYIYKQIGDTIHSLSVIHIYTWYMCEKRPIHMSLSCVLHRRYMCGNRPMLICEKRPIDVSLSCIYIYTRGIGDTIHILSSVYIYSWSMCGKKPILRYEKRPVNMSFSYIDMDTREIGDTEHLLSGVYMYTWHICEKRPMFICEKRPLYMCVCHVFASIRERLEI